MILGGGKAGGAAVLKNKALMYFFRRYWYPNKSIEVLQKYAIRWKKEHIHTQKIMDATEVIKALAYPDKALLIKEIKARLHTHYFGDRFAGRYTKS